MIFKRKRSSSVSNAALSFLQSSYTKMNLDPGDFRWIEVIRYSVRHAVDDREILQALIKAPGYAFSYAAPRLDPTLAQDPYIHGPYRLDSINEANFKSVTSSIAQHEIYEWIYDPSSLRPADEPFVSSDDDPRVVEMITAGQPIYTDSVVHLNPDIPPLLDRIFADSRRLFQLDDLRATAEHDWGWVVGGLGYVEIASISANRDEVALLVASDD